MVFSNLAIIHIVTIYLYLPGPELKSILSDAIRLEKAFQDELAESFSAFISAEESLVKLAWG